MNIKQIFTQHKFISISVLLLMLIILTSIVGEILLHRQRLPIAETTVVYVPTGSSFEALTDTLKAHNCIVDDHLFCSLARMRRLTTHVKGGRYELHPHMSVVRMINKLYQGNQDALHITINKHRTKKQLCDFFASKLEMNSDSLLQRLNNPDITASYGFTPETIISMFVQNTYDIYWNTTPDKLMERMKKEYDNFWSPVRKGECKDMGLTPQEVTILASIVEEETNKNDEKPNIASVYLNRLRCGMLLQADPTVKFALSDASIKRIRNHHLTVDNPYNTYKNKGLPPGPICLPSIASIDAVLANVKTDYLFFCAKEDFSGYHNFAATPEQHLQNAHKFHRALNRRNL